MRALVLVAIVASISLGGCRAILNYDQCNTDDECQSFLPDGGTAFCTSDHICSADYCYVDTTVGTPADDYVTIAGLFRISGADGQKDAAIYQSAELAVQEINQQAGRRLRLVLCDTGGADDQARFALTTAVEQYGAVAVIGPNSSSQVIALVSNGENLVKKYGVLVVSGAATSPAITSLDDGGLVWRTCASDTLQAKVLASLVPSSATTEAGAYESSAYGTGLETAFVEALSANGSAIKPDDKQFAEGTPASSVLTFLQSQAPAVSLIVADTDAPTWVSALSDGGAALSSTQYLLTDGAKSPDLFTSMPSPDLTARIIGTAPGVPAASTPSAAVFAAFQTHFKGQYGSDPAATAFTANTYDAVYVIAIAMGAVQGAVSGSLVAQAMGFLSSGKSEDVGPDDFTDAYNLLATTTQQVDLQGASGPIDFDTNGDVKSAPIEEWMVAGVTPSTAGFVTSFTTTTTVTP